MASMTSNYLLLFRALTESEITNNIRNREDKSDRLVVFNVYSDPQMYKIKIQNTRTLLLGLPTTKSSSELHGSGPRSSSSGLVVSGLPVGLSVSLLANTSGPGGGTGPRSGLPGSLSLQGGGDDLWGQVEIVTQVLDPLVGEAPVVMPPGKLLLHVAARLQGSQGLDDLNRKYRTW